MLEAVGGNADVSAGELAKSPPESLVVLGLALSAFAVAILLGTNPQSSILAVVGFSVWLLLVWQTVVSRRATSVLPALIVSILLMMTGVGGFLLWKPGDGASVVLELAPSAKIQAASLMVMSSLVVLSSAAVMAMLSPRLSWPRPQGLASGAVSVGPKFQSQLLSRVALGSVGLTIVGMGAQNIMYRSEYLEYPGGSSFAFRVAGLVAPVGLISAAALAASDSLRHRRQGWVYVVALVALFVSQGSRRLALAPVLVLLGRMVVGKRPSKNSVAFVLVLSLLLIPLPLTFRSQDVNGLLPHLLALPEAVTAGGWRTLSSNLLFGYPLSAAVAFHQPKIPISAFWISINPLPGELAGWYEISPSLRLNAFTPYSSIGELANYGAGILFAYLLSLGAVLVICANSLRRVASRFDSETGKLLANAFLLGISVFVGLNLVQYNLRSSTRVVYGLIAICVLASAVSRIASARRSTLKGP